MCFLIYINIKQRTGSSEVSMQCMACWIVVLVVVEEEETAMSQNARQTLIQLT